MAQLKPREKHNKNSRRQRTKIKNRNRDGQSCGGMKEQHCGRGIEAEGTNSNGTNYGRGTKKCSERYDFLRNRALNLDIKSWTKNLYIFTFGKGKQKS